MRLLPLLPPFARFALGAFYRLENSGPRPPESGPLLLVANHPNMAADAGGVIVAAARPVRFLGKAPLFSVPVAGPLLRAAGAIPVYRRQDDPDSVDRNEQTFTAARDALVDGSAIAIFPEGISHSDPNLAPMRTGAARIALLTARTLGGAFPIVPIGLTYRDKTRFHSRALAASGPPIEWSDLDPDGEGSVQELTRRIDLGIRKVTVNLDSWDDAPAVEAAEAIWAAERELSSDPESRLERRRDIARMLAALRHEDPEGIEALRRSVLGFDAVLRELRLTPRMLDFATRSSVAARWIAGRLLPFALAAIPLLAGAILFLLPYHLTAVLAGRFKGEEIQATVKILGGIVVYALWIVLLAIGAGLLFSSGLLAVLLLLALPPAALATLAGMQWWDRTRREAGTFLLLRSRASLHQRLRGRRKHLAAELDRARAVIEESRERKAPGYA